MAHLTEPSGTTTSGDVVAVVIACATRCAILTRESAIQMATLLREKDDQEMLVNSHVLFRT
jgi:hypothetical protein